MSQKTVCSEKEIEAPRGFERSSKRRNAIIIPESSRLKYYTEINSLKNLEVFEQEN